MENTDTTQLNSHTSDIYLLAKPQQRSNYSKLSSYPCGLVYTHTQTHTHWVLAENLKITKDRCDSRLHFIILHGMQQSGDRNWVSGNKNQTLCRYVCICVHSGTVRLTLRVMVLDLSSEKPKWVFKDYMGDDGCRKMWLYGSNAAFVPVDACPVRSLCTVTCGR